MKTTKVLLFITLSLISFLAYGQSYDTVLVKKYSVSSIKTYGHSVNKKSDKKLGSAFYFDKHGNLIEEYEESYTTPVMKYKYDSLNHMIEKANYKPDNTINDSYKWIYDSLGNLKTYTYYFSWQKKEYVNRYVYDANNRLIEMYEENKKNIKDYFSTYEYYNSGKLKTERFQNIPYGIDRTMLYDENGKIIAVKHNKGSFNYDLYPVWVRKRDILADKSIKITSTSELAHIHKKTIEVIRPTGLKESSEEYNYEKKDNSLSMSRISFYNKIGQMVEEKSFFSRSSMDDMDSYFHFKYFYYSNGLKKRIDYYDQKGKKTGYLEYIIEYYK
jgi:hypothetical protein